MAADEGARSLAGSPVPARVAVLGTGLMGTGIAGVFARSGVDVSLWDPDSSALRRALETVAESADGSTVALAPSVAGAVEQADLVIEAAPENVDLKRDLLSRVDAANATAIVASNTSAIPISQIASSTALPARFVGAHWWNPPGLIRLVEVVPGLRSSPDAIATTSGWLTAVGQMPVLVARDSPGLIGNRMQFALVREALAILEEGLCDAETLDLVVRSTFGARLPAAGPIENADYIGLDLTASILTYVMPSLSTAQEPPAILKGLIEDGKLGAKTGEGFRTWRNEDRQEFAERLITQLRRATEGAAAESA